MKNNKNRTFKNCGIVSKSIIYMSLEYLKKKEKREQKKSF